ncbi:Putative transposase (fragment) [Ralstonia solanacearum K60]
MPSDWHLAGDVYAWKKYSGIGVSEPHRLRLPEEENAKLKRLARRFELGQGHAPRRSRRKTLPPISALTRVNRSTCRTRHGEG